MSGTAPPPRREGCAVAAVAAGAARAGHGVRCAARAAMNGMAPPLVEPKERVLQLGETFEKQPRCAFHTVRCELGGVWGGGRCRAPGAGLQAPAWRGAGPRGAHAARGASVPGLEGGGRARPGRLCLQPGGPRAQGSSSALSRFVFRCRAQFGIKGYGRRSSRPLPGQPCPRGSSEAAALGLIRGRAGGSERCPVRSRAPLGAARREGSAARGQLC